MYMHMRTYILNYYIRLFLGKGLLIWLVSGEIHCFDLMWISPFSSLNDPSSSHHN